MIKFKNREKDKSETNSKDKVKTNKIKEVSNMKEINVYDFKPEIKDGIVKTMYTMNGLLNEIDFSMMSRDTIDMYLEGCLNICSAPYKEHKHDKLYCGLLFNGKQFRGWIYEREEEELKDRISEYTIDFINPKYSIVEVVN